MAATRYSRLDELKPENVTESKPVMVVMPTGLTNGHEGAPLIVDDTLYRVTPYPNAPIAVDPTQPGGAIKWTFDPGWTGATAFPSISADDPYAALGVVGAMKGIERATAPDGVPYVFAC
ncbi:MAG TPA: hypothetical protein PJ986_09720 [Gammaproteobacteria bacterium]|nr:hypothetical protein [Gammaproteobacteria bacterium]